MREMCDKYILRPINFKTSFKWEIPTKPHTTGKCTGRSSKVNKSEYRTVDTVIAALGTKLSSSPSLIN